MRLVLDGMYYSLCHVSLTVEEEPRPSSFIMLLVFLPIEAEFEANLITFLIT